MKSVSQPNHLISNGFLNFERSNVHQFCIAKSSCLMRKTTVKRISFFLEILMLYEVYSGGKKRLKTNVY